MKKLRFLQLEYDGINTWDDDGINTWDDDGIDTCEQHMSGDLKFLSCELRFLVWDRCPIKSFPSNFDPKNLVLLEIQYSHIEQLWEGTKPLQNLVRIDLSGSQYLIKTPDLTLAKNLQILNLGHCVSLVEVLPSISALKNLACLNLRGCKELKNFPSVIDMKSLEVLNLSGCSNLEKFRLEFSEDMKELTNLLLDETAITEITSSINNHSELQILSLRGCRELRSLPSSIHLESLALQLDLSGCSNLEEFPEISGDMNELLSLNLDGTAIKELPSSIEYLQGLKTLSMSNCRSLVCLPDNICKLACLEELYLDGCSKLSNLPENLGDLKHLSYLGVKRSGIQQLPLSIVRLWKLKFVGCKEMTAPFSSWPTWIQENPTCSVLVKLDLSDCNLLDLSDGIAHLSSLKSLKLCRNKNLESLPTTMNRLIQLSELYLEGCKRLKSIPELSLSIRFIDAHDCTALKTVSIPKPLNSEKFFNCFQLVQTNLFTDFVESATDNQAYYHTRALFVSLPAERGIPDWFTHQSRGSSITVQLPPNWFPYEFLGLAICAISNLRGGADTLESAFCFCTFKANDGDDEETFCFPLADWDNFNCNGADRDNFETIGLLESDHMFLVYKNSSSLGEWHNEGKYTEARFRIVTRSCGRLEDCSWITSCGVRLFHVNNEIIRCRRMAYLASILAYKNTSILIFPASYARYCKP